MLSGVTLPCAEQVYDAWLECLSQFVKRGMLPELVLDQILDRIVDTLAKQNISDKVSIASSKYCDTAS